MSQQNNEQPPLPSEVTFRYVESPSARVMHIDGIFGGLGPNGIHMAVFSQRLPIPESSTHEISPSGQIGIEKHREGADGVVRTIEAHLILHPRTAIVMRNWLDDKIKQIEETQTTDGGD